MQRRASGGWNKRTVLFAACDNEVSSPESALPLAEIPGEACHLLAFRLATLYTLP